MEIAHHLDKIETTVGIDLDSSTAKNSSTATDPAGGEYFLGSWAFARSYAKQVERRGNKTRYVAGILLDMVGGQNLQIKREPNSMQFAPAGPRSLGRGASSQREIVRQRCRS